MKPYNDQKLKFENGMYQITMQEAKANFEILLDDESLQRRLRKNSSHVYSYILTHSHSANAELIKNRLNETEKGREFIYRLLMAQMEADLMSGYNDLGKQVLVDVANGKTIDRTAIDQNLLCVDAMNILNNSASTFGFSLLAPFKVRTL